MDFGVDDMVVVEGVEPENADSVDEKRPDTVAVGEKVVVENV